MIVSQDNVVADLHMSAVCHTIPKPHMTATACHASCTLYTMLTVSEQYFKAAPVALAAQKLSAAPTRTNLPPQHDKTATAFHASCTSRLRSASTTLRQHLWLLQPRSCLQRPCARFWPQAHALDLSTEQMPHRLARTHSPRCVLKAAEIPAELMP